MSRYDPRDDEDSRDSRFGHSPPAPDLETHKSDWGRSREKDSQLVRPVEDPRRAQAEGRSRTDPRRVYRDRDRTYSLRRSEIEALVEIGKFRAIDPVDLAHYSYRDDERAMRVDLKNLARQGLIKPSTVDSFDRPRQLLTLTKQAPRLLRGIEQVPRDQALYHGFVKPREANHDADLYRLYQAEAERIRETEGGRSLRVILDFELKKQLNRELAKLASLPEREQNYQKHALAERHGLVVVNGKIPVPDLRIEYDTPDLSLARVDLELATRDYRYGHLADKVRAGFTIYAHADDASKLRRILEDRGLITEILSL